jgi:predicted nucleotidyltransferase
MYQHHKEGIDKFTEKMTDDKEVLAVIIGGSIAHGFATEKSDIDVMLVVSDEDFKKRMQISSVQFLDKENHIDGKYISVEFMLKVEKMGSEATRYAFEGAFITYSKLEGLDQLIKNIQRYPKEMKQDKINRFYAQFSAWKWYCKDAIKHNNMYLLNHAISNLVLFGGRLILAYNEVLYPYHKWFLRVLGNAPKKPENIVELINNLVENRRIEDVQKFVQVIEDFSEWSNSEVRWPNIFLYDSEWNWMEGKPPIADI